MTLTYIEETTSNSHTMKITSLAVKAVGGDVYCGKYRIYYGGVIIQTITSENTTVVKKGKSATIPVSFTGAAQGYTTAKGTSAVNGKPLALYHAVYNSESFILIGQVGLNIAALPQYKATYYPNGGSGSAQTQTYYHQSYNSTATTMTTKAASTFTRKNYAFDTTTGWNTYAQTSGTRYAAGTAYTPNKNLTLYARWTQIYSSPQLTVKGVYRCDDTGQMDDEGTNVTVVCDVRIWKTSTTNTCSSLTATVAAGSGTNPSASITTFSYTDPSGSTWREVNNVSLFVPCTSIASNSSFNAPLDPETSYSVTISVTDTQGATTTTATDKSYRTTTKIATVASSFYLIDFLDGSKGRGITIGGSANREGFNVRLPMTLGNGESTETAISYQGPNRIGPMIKFLPNLTDSYGDGIVIGGGGSVIIGSGESADNFRVAANVDAGTEHTYITSDGSIQFAVGCNTIENRKVPNISTTGTFTHYQSTSRISNNVASAVTVPSANTGVSGFYEYDAASNRCGYSEVMRSTTGLYRSFAVENPKSSVTTAIYLYADDAAGSFNGHRYGFTDPAAFRSGLGLGTMATKSSGTVNCSAVVTTKTYTKTYSVSASSNVTVSITGITLSNYTLVGFTAMRTGKVGVGINTWNLSGSELNVYVQNTLTSAQSSLTLTVEAKWVQTASLSRAVTLA